MARMAAHKKLLTSMRKADSKLVRESLRLVKIVKESGVNFESYSLAVPFSTPLTPGKAGTANVAAALREQRG